MPMVVSAAAIWLASNVGVLAATQWAATLFFVARVAAFYAISRALSPKLNAASLRAMATQVNVRDPAAPRQIIWGQRRVSGVLYPVGTSGTNNEYLHLILLLADHECEELGDVTFNDQVVPLDGSGNATGTYAGYVRIKKHLGAYDQTVDTDLQTDLGSSYWPSTSTGGGIAYLYIRLKLSNTLFPGGIPEIYCLVKGRKIYNPGDVAQSDTDPTTWTFSQNAALITYDWIRGVRTRNSAGTLVANYGVGAAATEVDETALEDSANNCEELVTLADASTEHRYYANGTLLTSVKAGDGLDILKSAMAGDVVFSGGTWLVLSGYYRTPTLSAFGEGDLRAPLKGVRLKPALADLCNSVRGVYISADNAWQPADFPQVKNATYKTEDGEEDFPTDVELQMTTSSPTAQRLAKIILERSRQGITFLAPCKLGAWRVRPGDVITWTDADFGWSAKPFEVLAVALAVDNDAHGQPYLGVDLTLKETASGVWDWANGEETTVDLAANTTLRSPFEVAAPTSLVPTVTSFRQPDGTLIPQLQLAWTAPADAYVTTAGFIRIQYKKSADSDWIDWGRVKGDQVFDYITAALLLGINYDFQIRSENQLDQPSAWLQSLAFTVTADSSAPAVPTGLAAVVGTGQSVSLDWDDNTEADFSEYGIYRSTTSGVAGFSKIAEVRASRFVDVDVTIGTAYWYRLTAFDDSENESAQCTAVTATPTTVPSASLDPAVLADIAAAQADATAAAAAAAAAQSDATTALNDLADISSDSILSQVEKPTVILDYTNITGEQAGIDAQATTYGITTEKTAYDAAVSALTSYLGGLTSPVAWNNLTADTTIVGTTFRSKFADVYSTRQALLNEIYAQAKAVADAQAAAQAATPSTPSAPTYVSEGTYLAGDGTVFANVTVACPALPSGAKLNQLLYQVSGSTAWTIADELDAAGNKTVDDLTPGVAYVFAVRAISFANVPSAVSTTLAHTAPNKSTGPSAPASGGIGSSPASILTWSASSLYFGANTYWAPITDADLKHYEVKSTTTDSDAATDYLWFPKDGVAGVITTRETRLDYYRGTPANGFVRVRAVDKSGNTSSWLRLGNLATYCVPLGGTLAIQDSSDVDVSAIKTGDAGASSVRQVVAVFHDSVVPTLSGGSPTEKFNVSLSNRGFSTKPDAGVIGCSSDANIAAAFDWDDAGNSSTNAVVRAATLDGTNIGAGSYRFSCDFIEYN